MAEDGWSATPQNEFLGTLAKLLRKARNNPLGMPEGTFAEDFSRNLGELILGKSPEEVENWSYGNPPAQLKAEGDKLPSLKSERKSSLFDTMSMVPDVGDLGKISALSLAGAIRKSGKPFTVKPEKFIDLPDLAMNPYLERGAWTDLRALHSNYGDVVDKKATKYINKYLGTPEDPLKDVELPVAGNPNKTWGEIMDEKVYEIRPEDVTPAWHVDNPEWMRSDMPADFVGPMPNIYEARIRTPKGNVSVEGDQAEELIKWLRAGGEDIKYGLLPLDHVSDTMEAGGRVGNTLAEGARYALDHRTPEQIQQADFPRLMRNWPEEMRKIEAEKLNNPAMNFAHTEPVLELPDGNKWVKMDPEALKREGELMSHCIGQSCDLPADEFRAYSLRDPKGKSSVTISTKHVPGDDELKPFDLTTPQFIEEAYPLLRQEYGDREAFKIYDKLMTMGDKGLFDMDTLDIYDAISKEFPWQQSEFLLNLTTPKHGPPAPGTWEIEQIKGRSNHPVKDEYSNALIEFLRKAPELGIKPTIPEHELRTARIIQAPSGEFRTVSQAYDDIRQMMKTNREKVGDVEARLLALGSRDAEDFFSDLATGRTPEDNMHLLQRVYRNLFN